MMGSMDNNSSSNFGHNIISSHTFNPVLEPDTLSHPPDDNQQNLHKFSQLGGSGFSSGQTVPDTVINEQGQETSDKEVLNT